MISFLEIYHFKMIQETLKNESMCYYFVTYHGTGFSPRINWTVRFAARLAA